MSKYTKNPKKNYTFLSYELPSSLVDDEQPTYLTNLKKKKNETLDWTQSNKKLKKRNKT